MRRLLALAVLPSVAATACQIAFAGQPIPGPTPSVPGPRAYAAAGAGQGAQAEWLFLGRDHGTFYFALASRAGQAGVSGHGPFAGVDAFAVIGRGTCDVIRRRHFVIVSCGGRAWGREIPPTQLEMDPILRSGRLALRLRGRRHVVRWTGRGRLYPGGGAFFGPDYAEGSVGAARGATAEGRLFGQKLAARGGPFTYLAEGAGAFSFVEPQLGSFRWERSFRVAR